MTCSARAHAQLKGVQLSEDDFGELTDENGEKKTIRRFTLTNSNKMSVQIITYGGYVTSIKVPDKQGNVEDIVVGFNNLEGYLKPENRYFGATVGRVANRIGGGKMAIEGQAYSLAVNNGPNHLHGGIKGFDKVVWEHYVKGNTVILSYHSSDLEEGYPGDVLVNITFELTEDNEFLIDYKASTTKPTCVNLTNHSYFNLAGHNKGAEEIYKHVVTINADKITEVDSDSTPTGRLLPVADTVFDLRIPKVLGDVIKQVPDSPGYDHNFCIARGSEQGNVFVAKVSHPDTERTMEVYSNQPGVQFYTGNFLPEDDALTGKDGFIRKHGAFCLETQIYPDSINHENFGRVPPYSHLQISLKFVEVEKSINQIKLLDLQETDMT